MALIILCEKIENFTNYTFDLSTKATTTTPKIFDSFYYFVFE